MKVICTICSRRKVESTDLLPANERYTGDHVLLVKQIAQNLKQPFYILSGKLGLVNGEEKIPYYDYYLEESAIPELIEKVSKQILESGITEIDFYLEEKPSWLPYENVINGATKKTGIKIKNNHI